MVCFKSLRRLCISLGSITGALDKVGHGHLQSSPGGSDSGGPEIFTLKFSTAEGRKKLIEI